MGRPPKYTPEVTQRIVNAIAAGNFLETAAAYGGISYECFNQWIRRGERETDGIYFQFLQDVHEAKAKAEVTLVATIKRASTKDWKAAGWMLSRRYPERWSETQRIKVEVEKELSQTLDVLKSKLPTEIYFQVLQAIAEEYKTEFPEPPK
jgi:transposase